MLTFELTDFKGTVSRYSVIFCASKKWRLLTQGSRTSDHDSAISRVNSFTAQDKWRKCHFLLSCMVAAIFPHTKWLKKKSPIIVTLPLNFSALCDGNCFFSYLWPQCGADILNISCILCWILELLDAGATSVYRRQVYWWQ